MTLKGYNYNIGNKDILQKKIAYLLVIDSS